MKKIKIPIMLEDGTKVEAMAPVIVSASRATDIPAFYSQWMIERLKAGYVVWTNPFNRKDSYVSFNKCKVIVFWTKNPKPLMPYFDELDRRGIHYYFQYTLNDYEQEKLEPNVPSLEDRVKTFIELSERIGKERVIWRFAPIIMIPGMTVRQVLQKIWNVGNKIKGNTEKLVFSFVDVNGYRKVKRNMVNATQVFDDINIEHAEPETNQIEEIVAGLAKMRDYWKTEGWNIELATCAEGVDLSQYGVSHNRCVDAVLMKKVFAEDKDLIHYLKYGEMKSEGDLFADDVNLKELTDEDWKDKGQRKACGCMESKDIGRYNTCKHFCAYCYANDSKEAVLKNIGMEDAMEK